MTRRFGRRASMLIGGTVFIAGSVFGGAAVNVPMLLLNRILLGIGLGFTNQVTPAAEIQANNLFIRSVSKRTL